MGSASSGSRSASRLPLEQLYGVVGGQQLCDAMEERLQDNTRTPVPDQAAFRLDFPPFLASLSERDRRLAAYLALGHSAVAAAAALSAYPRAASRSCASAGAASGASARARTRPCRRRPDRCWRPLADSAVWPS